MIQDQAKFIASLPNWDFLSGCFGPGIRPTDIDGCVERNGKCLFLEHKGPGVILKNGQHRTFLSLSKEEHTVMVFWGPLGNGGLVEQVHEMAVYQRGQRGPKIKAGVDAFREQVADWYKLADSNQSAKPPARLSVEIAPSVRKCRSCGAPINNALLDIFGSRCLKCGAIQR
jgi:hypothetical protein